MSRIHTRRPPWLHQLCVISSRCDAPSMWWTPGEALSTRGRAIAFTLQGILSLILVDSSRSSATTQLSKVPSIWEQALHGLPTPHPLPPLIATSPCTLRRTYPEMLWEWSRCGQWLGLGSWISSWSGRCPRLSGGKKPPSLGHVPGREASLFCLPGDDTRTTVDGKIRHLSSVESC